MAVVRLLGEHISYSASPAMQSAAFAALGLNHTFELADVAPGELHRAVAALRGSEVLGANVTVPHKAAMLDLVDEIDAVAVRAGAVNCIVNRDGELFGSNTDIPGIAEEIRRLVGAPRRAVVLGAGGAARAVSIALQLVGAGESVLVSRSAVGKARPWAALPELLAQADLLVNATPVGTNIDDSPIDPSLLHPGLAVLDLVYRPSPTSLVRDARERGLPASAGAGVLLGQGWRSLEAWLRQPISDSVKKSMAEALTKELGASADV